VAAAQYQAVSWDDALAELVGKLDALEGAGNQKALAWIARGGTNHRAALVARFLGRFGAPAPVTYELFGDDVLRHANDLSFGRAQLPTFDLANAHYVLSLGATSSARGIRRWRRAWVTATCVRAAAASAARSRRWKRG
jgi:hypothetical protein